MNHYSTVKYNSVTTFSIYAGKANNNHNNYNYTSIHLLNITVVGSLGPIILLIVIVIL